MKTIEYISESIGVSKSTLRYWEKLKLIPEPMRDSRNYRCYTEEQIVVIREVFTFHRFGLNIKQLKELQFANKNNNYKKIYEILMDSKTELEKQKEIIKDFEIVLNEKLDIIKSSGFDF